MSVDAFPMSSWVQFILCLRPSRDVHFVKPRMACLEIVYEKESEPGLARSEGKMQVMEILG